MKMHILVFTIILAPFNMGAEPTFKRFLDINSDDSDEICSTVGFYDANTSVTFFGDSRIDLVDNLAYGAASLDHYLSTKGSWNVQNFGVGGIDSYGLRDQLQICFKRDSSNPAKANNPNFKTAYNVASEFGGNDYALFKIPFFILNPGLYITRVPQSHDNIASVIYTLQMREKKVLHWGEIQTFGCF